MKKIVLIFITLTLVVAAAILFFNRGERSPTGAELLPESTLLFVNVPDFQTARSQIAGTPLSALWAEPEVQAFFEKPLATLRESMGSRRDGTANDKWQEALALLQGEVFVAITHFVMDEKRKDIGIAIGANVKLRKPQALLYLKYYEHQLAKYNPTAKVEKKTYLGIDYTLVQAGPTSRLGYGFLGTLLVAASDENQLRDMITRYTGNALPDMVSLAASSRYRKALHHLPKNRAGQAFINTEEVVKRFGGLLIAVAASGNQMLQGVGNMEGTTACVLFDGTGLTDSTLITYARDHKPDAPIQRRTLVATPGDTALYAVHEIDLADSFAKSMTALALSSDFTGSKLGVDIGRHLSAAAKTANDYDKLFTDAGVRFSDDFLAHLGPEVAYIGNWRQGARAPDFAVVVEVKNPAAVAAKFATIVQIIKQAADRTDDLVHADESLHIIRTASSYLAPTYALTGKYFVLAATPDYAKEIITQIKSGTSSLADAADFKNVSQRVPTGGSSFTYCDLRRVIGGLYALAHSNTTAPADPAALLPWNRLPQPASITRHLGPYVCTTVESDKASTTTTYSPIGKPMTLVLALAGGIAALQPFLAQLPAPTIPELPTMSSGTGAPPPPPGNQTVPSQTPTP